MSNQFKTVLVLVFGIFVGVSVSLTSSVLAEKKAEESSGLPLNELRNFSDIFARIKTDYVENVEDKTLLENAIQSAIDSKATNIVLVTGASQDENKALIKNYSVETVWNEHWKKGIGSSIKCGLQYFIQSFEKQKAVIISVCDQPFITSGIFNKLIEAYLRGDKKIIASAYNKSYGVPVIYDESLFEQLLEIPDEYGAKRFVVENAPKEQVGKIPFPKGEIDIDTVEDIKRLNPSK